MKNSKPYQIVVENLINAIEKAIKNGEKLPWQRPWNLNGKFRNMASKHCFTGIVNLLILHYAGEGCTRFATWKQIASCGGKVKSGFKQITLLRPVIVPEIDENKKPVLDKNGKQKSKLIGYNYYKVIADKYVDGGKFPKHEEDIAENSKIEFTPIEQAENIIALHDDLNLSHGGNQAFYMPSNDSITMPEKEHFKSIEDYYFTLFHEMGHWARIRVNQEKREENETYAFEELVAEFTSAIMGTSANLNFENVTFDNSAAYLQGWLSKLQSNITWLSVAAKLAEIRSEYLLNPIEWKKRNKTD